MKLRTTGFVLLCLAAGGAAAAAYAATPYAYGPSGTAFAPSDLDKVKAPVPGKAPAAKPQPAQPEDATLGLPAGPQPYVPGAPAVAPVKAETVKAEPVKAEPVKAEAAPPAPAATKVYVPAAPVPAAVPVSAGPQPYVPSAPVAAPVSAAPIPAAPAKSVKAAPVKASAQALPAPVTGPAAAGLPACTYGQIRKTGFDAYVGRMWAARTPESQRALIGCIDQAWNYHLSGANSDPNNRFEEQASPAMLAAMQYDLDGFVKELEGRQKLRLMWLATLASDSFSWRSATPCEHDGQRRTLQTLLDARKTELQTLVAYRDIQDAFSNIQCRTAAAN